MDVLMCLGSRDVRRLFLDAVSSCAENFELLNRITVVTDAKAEAEAVLQEGTPPHVRER